MVEVTTKGYFFSALAGAAVPALGALLYFNSTLERNSVLIEMLQKDLEVVKSEARRDMEEVKTDARKDVDELKKKG